MCQRSPDPHSISKTIPIFLNLKLRFFQRLLHQYLCKIFIVHFILLCIRKTENTQQESLKKKVKNVVLNKNKNLKKIKSIITFKIVQATVKSYSGPARLYIKKL